MNIKEIINSIKKENKNESTNNNQTELYSQKLEHIKEEDISSEVYSMKSSNSNEPISLDGKINNFIDWYYKNMVKGKYSAIGEYHFPRELRNFIEKMAVWYELRYPQYEVNRLMPGSGQEGKYVNEEMFINNPYVNNFLEISNELDDVKFLDWSEFYNTKAFINSLPWEERNYLSKPRYTDLVYIDLSKSANTHLHLSANGIVMGSEGIYKFTNSKIKDKDLEGKHVKEVLDLLEKENISLSKDNELQKAIELYEKKVYFKEHLLDCVMYRIIERGGSRIGPRRAFLFAKEFKRNIDIPMMYGVDYSDPGLRNFIIEYIKAGGSEDLICYTNYFTRKSACEKINTTTIKELFKTRWRSGSTKYTEEETELHQRLVDVLSSQVDYDIVEQEKTEQLSLVRKLKKSNKK